MVKMEVLCYSSAMLQAHSIYIHIPFCEKRCSYCDFNTYAGINYLIPAYVDAIIREIGCYGDFLGHGLPIGTVFFGGGTPSLLAEKYFARIFDSLQQQFDLSAVKEISLEANPGTVSRNYLANLREIGFNRISFGVQTSYQKYLNLMGRIHNYADAVQAVGWAKQAGFYNINADLIYGLPDQTLSEWLETLAAVSELGCQHYSLYALGVEENTPLWAWIKDGKVNAPDDDLAAGMYETAVNYLSMRNFIPYEISNFALMNEAQDFRCQHNLQYWRNQPYLGIGAGAHGYVRETRTENIRSVPAYIKSISSAENASGYYMSPAVEFKTDIDEFTAMQETMMVGLRLLQEGVSIPKFVERFQKSPLQVFEKEFDFLIKNQLVHINQEQVITIPPEKVMISNQIFQHFVN
jgi:oxygen-independent coproporphyrinogen-3 oxidase